MKLKKLRIMKKIYQFICAICVICGFTACQDRELPGSGEMQVASPDVTTITGTPSGDNNYDYTITWPQSSQGATMQVAVYKNGTQMQALTPCPSGSFTLKNLETNQLYEFLFNFGIIARSFVRMDSYCSPDRDLVTVMTRRKIDRLMRRFEIICRHEYLVDTRTCGSHQALSRLDTLIVKMRMCIKESDSSAIMFCFSHLLPAL